MADAPLSSDLQLTVQETPGMTTPLPWRVFKMDDCDWWMARTLDEARTSYKHETGVDDEMIEDARELTDEEMDKLTFVDVDENERPDSKTRRTFREELRQRVELHERLRAEHGIEPKPELFACTEY